MRYVIGKLVALQLLKVTLTFGRNAHVCNHDRLDQRLF